MEGRLLLATAQGGFLAGSVFVEGANAQPLAGVTVALYPVGSNTPVASTVTDANGYYELTGLAPGQYVLKELPPTGYVAASGTTIRSQLNPASPGSEPGTINVRVADPESTYVAYRGVVPGSTLNMQVSIRGEVKTNAAGPLSIGLGTTPGGTDLSGTLFSTLCVDNLQDLSYEGGENFRVVPRPITDLTDGLTTISADHAGRIAYLFNQYADTTLDAINGAALQLAVWELLYDPGNTPDFTAGAFQVVGTYPPTEQAQLDAAIARATLYFNESTGKNEPAVFLDAASATPGLMVGQQSMLATNQLNFTVRPIDCQCECNCQLDNIRYVINGCKVVTTLAGNVHMGDVIEAKFTVPEGCKETISFVSYSSKYGYCDPKFYTGETLYSYDTGTFCGGEHSLKIHVPCDNFEIDLVCGKVLHSLAPHNGTTYEAQGRLIEQVQGSKPYKGKTSPQAGKSFKNGNSYDCENQVCHTGCGTNGCTPAKPVPPPICQPVVRHTGGGKNGCQPAKPVPPRLCKPVVKHAAPRAQARFKSQVRVA